MAEEAAKPGTPAPAVRFRACLGGEYAIAIFGSFGARGEVPDRGNLRFPRPERRLVFSCLAGLFPPPPPPSSTRTSGAGSGGRARGLGCVSDEASRTHRFSERLFHSGSCKNRDLFRAQYGTSGPFGARSDRIARTCGSHVRNVPRFCGDRRTSASRCPRHPGRAPQGRDPRSR